MNKVINKSYLTATSTTSTTSTTSDTTSDTTSHTTSDTITHKGIPMSDQILCFRVTAANMYCGKLFVSVNTGLSKFYPAGMYSIASNWTQGAIDKVSKYKQLSITRFY